MFDIPNQIDYRHIRKIGQITTTADYTTGNITDISSTSVTGDGTSWTSANSNNLLLKVSGNDELYRVTYSSGTALTLDRTWVETDISSTDTGYTLYQDRYALASDFDHMILDPNRAVYYWSGGNKVYLKYRSPEDFEAGQVITPGTPSYYTIKWVSGDPYLYIDGPDTSSRTLEYAYIPTLKRMAEYTTGTITTLANAGTAVTGSGTNFDGFVTDTTAYDYYFRIDGDGTGADSKWYKISSAGSDTGITLSDAYEGTAISSGTSAYTISVVSLLPPGLDLALLYGAALIGAIDQTNNSQIKAWSAMYEKAVTQFKSIENKKNFGVKRVRTIYENSGVRR